jgi:acetyl esterase/lipase
MALLGVAVVTAVLAGACSSTSDVPPLPAVPDGVVAGAEIFRDVAYADVSPAQTLHLSLPTRTGSVVPLVILVHGGGWFSGDERDVVQQVRDLNAAGYATAAIGYRLTDEAVFPAAVQDVKAAIRWLRANAAVHGIDPTRFALWGYSAGGNLADLAAVTGTHRTEFDDAALGHADQSAAVQAVVSWYAPTDFGTMDAQNEDPGGCRGTPEAHGWDGSAESRWLGAPVESSPELVARAAPATYLQDADIEALPPFHLAHGDRDCTVPYGQMLEFQRALQEAGVRVTAAVEEGQEHATWQFADAQYAESQAFLDEVFDWTEPSDG